MASSDRVLGVGIVGLGWCAAEHLKAFLRNPHARIVCLCGRDEVRARARLAQSGVDLPEVRFTSRYADLLKAPDVDLVSITTPNHLHADQAVAAAQAGKHFILEKPTGLSLAELQRIREAVRRSRVRTIVSFELHYNPFVRFAHWLRESGWLGRIRYARFEYLSRMTDWYSGWTWYRTTRSGRSHLLAAGCHAVDALRWCSGLEATAVTAFHTRLTAGYQWPTSIVVNLELERGALGQVVSSTDFMMPYTFGVQLMGDRATLRQDLIQWHDTPIDLEGLREANPFADVALEPALTAGGSAIRIVTKMPDSADVSGHPFQGEIDEIVVSVLEDRETHLNVFDAQKTMEICLAADVSASRYGRPVRLPLGTVGRGGQSRRSKGSRR